MTPPKKLRIFLIEDAPKIRAMLMEILQHEEQIEVIGYAESETDALIQLRSRDWDVAIVDIGLRQGNGLGVLAGLKKDQKQYGTRLVFTSSSNAALAARTRALGAEGIYDKSRDINSLISHLQQMAH